MRRDLAQLRTERQQREKAEAESQQASTSQQQPAKENEPAPPTTNGVSSETTDNVKPLIGHDNDAMTNGNGTILDEKAELLNPMDSTTGPEENLTNEKAAARPPPLQLETNTNIDKSESKGEDTNRTSTEDADKAAATSAPEEPPSKTPTTAGIMDLDSMFDDIPDDTNNEAANDAGEANNTNDAFDFTSFENADDGVASLLPGIEGYANDDGDIGADLNASTEAAAADTTNDFTMLDLPTTGDDAPSNTANAEPAQETTDFDFNFDMGDQQQSGQDQNQDTSFDELFSFDNIGDGDGTGGEVSQFDSNFDPWNTG